VWLRCFIERSVAVVVPLFLKPTERNKNVPDDYRPMSVRRYICWMAVFFTVAITALALSGESKPSSAIRWATAGLFLLAVLVIAVPYSILRPKGTTRADMAWMAVPLVALLVAGIAFALS
jgi:hypothetical protein